MILKIKGPDLWAAYIRPKTMNEPGGMDKAQFRELAVALRGNEMKLNEIYLVK